MPRRAGEGQLKDVFERTQLGEDPYRGEGEMTLAAWLDEYSCSHQNPVNKRIHWVCVPLIVFSLIGLLWSLPLGPLRQLNASASWLNWGSLFLLLGCGYYLWLSRAIFVGMLVFSLLVGWGNILLSSLALPLWVISLVVFVAAWIGQFVGHKIEGKKPSFFKDIQFLLIGPAWCLSYLYGKLGIRI